MAQEEVVIKIGVDGKAIAPAKESVASLRKELKLANDALLNGDGNAAKKVNELTSKIQDLGRASKSATSSGVENLSSSFGLFSEGIQNADFGKVISGIKGMGAAMAAVPIFFLIEGVKLLIDNFGKVIDFGKELFDVFSDDERAIRKLNAQLESQKETTSKLVKELSREIEVMDAQGKSHSQILAKKKELIQAQIDEAIVTAKLNLAKIREVINNDSISESIDRQSAALLRKLGLDEKADLLEKAIQISKVERNAENIKALNESLELVKDLKNKEKVEIIKVNNEIVAANKTKNEQIAADNKTLNEQFKENKENALNELVAGNQKEIDANFQKNDQLKVNAEDVNAQEQLINDKYAQIDKEKKKEKQEEEFNSKLKATEQYLEASKALSDLFFSFQLKKAKGNEKEELAIRKRMFQVDKAFNVARAVIDGIRSVQAALTLPPPAGQILAVINGVVAAANVAKILTTKFDGGGGGGSVDASVPTASPSLNAPPPINTQGPIINPSTTFNSQGQNMQYQKVYVVEKDITDTQGRVAKLEAQRTI